MSATAPGRGETECQIALGAGWSRSPPRRLPRRCWPRPRPWPPLPAWRLPGRRRPRLPQHPARRRERLRDHRRHPHSRLHPPHNNDQLDEYGDLVYQSPRLTESDVNTFYKDASFGIQAGHVGRRRTRTARSSARPRPTRRTATTSPSSATPALRRAAHLRHRPRRGAVRLRLRRAPQDRLFFMDVERHLGRGNLASFLGGSNAATDRSTWRSAPYTEADLQPSTTPPTSCMGPTASRFRATWRTTSTGSTSTSPRPASAPT